MKSKSINIKNILLYILISSFFFGRFYFNFVFAIKPYMFATMLCLLYLLATKQLRIMKPTKYEMTFIVFSIFVFFTSIFSSDITDSFRYICGFIFIFFIYCVIKSFLLLFQVKDIGKAIIKVGFLYGILSLLYYFYGLSYLSYVPNGGNYCGVLVDRNIVRLISMSSTDPNISALYFCFFFYFYVSNFKYKYGKLGTLLYFILIILTLSRGAIISLIFGILLSIIFYIKNNKIKISKVFFFGILMLFVVFFLGFKFDVFDTIIGRFSSNDGGSGRLDLWASALTTFYDHPLIGIGINNTLDYNMIYYNLNHYIHNTYLEVLSELGFFGMSIYMCFIIFIFYEFKKTSFKNPNILYCFLFLISLFTQQVFLSLLLNEMLYFFLTILFVFKYRGVEVND